MAVESGSKGFISEHKPVILFEGHVFWRQLKKRGFNPENYTKGNEDILFQAWNKKYYNQDQWARFNKAKKINSNAAIEATSWGLFQIMGFNYKDCGCKSPTLFMEAMCRDEETQKELFIKFIESNPNLVKALTNKDWELFAKLYNGPSYKQNSYDKKLEIAYNRAKKGELRI